jgi:hypothetical protein
MEGSESGTLQGTIRWTEKNHEKTLWLLTHRLLNFQTKSRILRGISNGPNFRSFNDYVSTARLHNVKRDKRIRKGRGTQSRSFLQGSSRIQLLDLEWTKRNTRTLRTASDSSGNRTGYYFSICQVCYRYSLLLYAILTDVHETWNDKVKKSKDVPEQAVQILRIPHCIYVQSAHRQRQGCQPYTPAVLHSPENHFSASGVHFCKWLCKSQGLVRPVGLGKLKTKSFTSSGLEPATFRHVA